MVRYRTTGVTFGAAGVQWERKDDDREIASRVLNLLADRRMLWKDFSLEVEEHCVKSANQIRRDLGSHLDNPEISDHLASRIRVLQSLFRAFVDEIGPGGDDPGCYRWRSAGTDPLSMALGRLRGLVGVQIGVLASEYDLDVSDELATIIPDQDEWFFKRFEK